MLPAPAIAVALAVDAATGGVLVAELATPLVVLVAACLLLGRRAATRAGAAAGAALAVTAMTLANQLAPGVEYPPLDDLVFFALLLGTPVVVGVLLRERGAAVEELAGRAEALRAALEEQAAAAVAEERARVTIGVHDALAAPRRRDLAAGGRRPARRRAGAGGGAGRARADRGRRPRGARRHPGGDRRAATRRSRAGPHAPARPERRRAGAMAGRGHGPRCACTRPQPAVAAPTHCWPRACSRRSRSRRSPRPSAKVPWRRTLALIALATAPLAFRRRVPLAAALATVAALAVQEALLTPRRCS